MGYKNTVQYKTPDLIFELIELTKKLRRQPQTREFGQSKATHLMRRFGKWIYVLEHIGAWPSKEDLKIYYLDRKLSCEKIRKMYPPLTKNTIQNLIHKHGFKMRKITDYEMPKGQQSHRWRGGRIVIDGYVYIGTGKKRRGEHRIVMEKIIGRNLSTNEHVHHLNGVRHDNRPENLCVMSKAEHHREGRTLANIQAARIRELEKSLNSIQNKPSL